jgi:hypothetical protein
MNRLETFFDQIMNALRYQPSIPAENRAFFAESTGFHCFFPAARYNERKTQRSEFL